MTSDRTAPSPVSSRPGTHDKRLALDIGWLSALVVFTVGTVTLWLMGRLEVEAALWAMFLCTSAALAIEAVIERAAGGVWAHALEVSQAQRVVWLVVMWHVVGGIDVPLFLFAFVPAFITPVVLIEPRLPWVTAGASVVSVSGIALVESPELRWFLLQRGLPVQWILSLPADGLRGAATSPSLDRDPQTQLAALILFATVALVLAVVAIPLGGRVRRICERLRIARARENRPLDSIRATIWQDPTPTALVDRDDGLIVAASRTFINRMLLTPDRVVGQFVFDVLSFDSEASVRSLLSQPSGVLPVTPYRIGTEGRMARVTAHQISLGDNFYAVLRVDDLEGLSYLSLAADTLDEPLVIVRDRRDIVYYNEAARQRWSWLYFGIDAERLLVDEHPSFAVDTMDLPPAIGGESLTLVRMRASGATGVDTPVQYEEKEPASPKPEGRRRVS